MLPITLLSADALAVAGESSDDRVTLIDTPDVFAGVKTFQPGEVFPNHFHEGYDEFFAVLEGVIVVWQGRAVRSELRAGASLLCMRGSHHCLVNESGGVTRLLYAKVPMIQDDTHWVEWAPGGAA